jgi:hypothetical protein
MTSTSCNLCLKYKGKRVCHGIEGCTLGASTLCRRCFQRGHLSVDCTAPHPQWERPKTLEELIPIDIRLRYKINTHTLIQYGGDRELSELPDINTIIVPDSFKELSEFVEQHGIRVEKVTKPGRKALLKAVKAWGVSHGYRIVQEVSVPTISYGTVDEVAVSEKVET